MPTYAVDESFFEDNDIPFNEEEFTRGPNRELIKQFTASAVTFEAGKLGEQAQIVLDALLAIGVTEISGRYDGGGDEGFAHFETVILDGQTKNLKEITPLLRVLAETTLQKTLDGDSIIFMNCYYSWHRFDLMSIEQKSKDALDYLCFVLASKLLGKDYGTGEGSIYGVFRANLKTGEIVDEHVDAPASSYNPEFDDLDTD